MTSTPTQFTRRRLACTVLMLPAAILLTSCTTKSDPQENLAASKDPTPLLLPKFLANADLQVETDAQREELQRTLHDIATLPPGKLATKRYADYQGRAGQWTALRTLRAYFYSPSPLPSSDEAFYEELGNPAVRESVHQFTTKNIQALGVR